MRYNKGILSSHNRIDHIVDIERYDRVIHNECYDQHSNIMDDDIPRRSADHV
jgi:hypothetical protein